MGKSTISMVIFNSYATNYQRVPAIPLSPSSNFFRGTHSTHRRHRSVCSACPPGNSANPCPPGSEQKVVWKWDVLFCSQKIIVVYLVVLNPFKLFKTVNHTLLCTVTITNNQQALGPWGMFAVSCDRVVPTLSLAPAASIELSHHRRRLSPGAVSVDHPPLQPPCLALACPLHSPASGARRAIHHLKQRSQLASRSTSEVSVQLESGLKMLKLP